jgi:hypothetical protein
VIRGKKRMLAWPFEYFLGRVKGVTPADRYFNKRLAIDHTPYRKDAVVLDAEAGDVIYWPSHYWHVAEPRDDGFSAMLSLGIFRREGAAPRGADWLDSRDLSAGVRGADIARQLRWRTSFGFEMGGPAIENAPRERARAPVTVVQAPCSLIQWKEIAAGRLVVAANGHSMTLPRTTDTVTLLERLARGEAVVADGSGAPPATAPAKFSESFWTQEHELKLRSRESRRDPSALLVDWLSRVYAVEPVRRVSVPFRA